MEKSVETRYSPPHLSRYVQSCFTLGAMAMGVATYIRGDYWPQIQRLRDWQQIIVTTTPFLVGRYLTGRFFRPVRELPDGVVRLTTEPGEKPARPVADLFRWALRPLGQNAIYQATIPMAQCSLKKYRKERQGLVDALHGQQVQIESYQEPGRNHTLLLEGLRFEPQSFETEALELDAEARERFAYLGEVAEDKNEVVLIFPAFGGTMHAYLWLAAFFTASGRSVQIVNWRGFGESEGDPYPEGIELDVEAAVDAAKTWKPGAKITCYGHCAGGDLTLYAAKYAGKDVKGVVLDRVPVDWGTLVHNTTWYFGWPLGKLASWLYPYDCKARAEALNKDVPLHLFRAVGDQFLRTPQNEDEDLHVKPLYTRAGNKVHTVDDCGHFESWWVEEKFTTAQQELLVALGDGA